MANIRKIITLLGQKHNYKNLGELFTEATEEEKEDILKALGLDEILVPGGGFIPKYSVDITSNKPTFITKDFDITLTSRVYNFFDLVPDTDVTSWAWTRDSGDPAADTTWALGKSTKAIVLTSTDFPGIATGDITFSLTVTVKGKVITDTITFTKTISNSRLRIKSTAQVFVDNLPEKAILSEDFDGVIETYSWFLNDIFRASTPTFRVDYSDLIPGEIGEIKLEATTDLGEILTDVFLIPRLKNGENGTDGVPGPPGIDGSPRYIWIKYADDDLGTDMSDVPTKVDGSTRAYIGIAVNRTVQAESTNYLDYTWSKYTGNPGPKGVSGPSPRILEFVPGGTYENGGLYIDYVYFRSSNPATEGYYTVKLPSNHISGTKVTVVYPGGIPNIDPTTGPWVKAPFTKEMSFGTVVAEQANLAGFLFRNQVLQSQTGSNMTVCHPESGQHKPNLSLDGLSGVIKFLDRMVMDKSGIVLKDDCGVRRMAFQWGLMGVPILKFFAEDGITVTWEAGKDGYVVVTEGTRTPSWGPDIGIRKLLNIPNNPELDFTPYNNTVKQAIQSILVNKNGEQVSFLQTAGDTNLGAISWSPQAFPNSVPYNETKSGAVSKLNKGDIDSNKNLHEGYYVDKQMIQTNQVANSLSLFPEDGWYLFEKITGENGLVMFLDTNVNYTLVVQMLYLSKGVVAKEKNISVKPFEF